jgi:Hypothetical protein (DUF2513)
MRRDMDLIRKILLKAENAESSDIPKDLHVDGYTQEQVKYHLKLLTDANLITNEQHVPLFESKPESTNWKMSVPRRLSWEGHEFLDAARDETRWNEAKKIAGQKGGSMAFDVIKGVLVQLALKVVNL